jgi:4-hydroxyphenylpyruvate dioxygenase
VARTRGPEELPIPAIRGLGGALLHVVDGGSGPTRLWEVDFAPSPAEGPGAGLTRIDHVAQTLSREKLLSGGLRIAPNGAEGRRTLAGRFLAEKLGPAIRHVAFLWPSRPTL